MDATSRFAELLAPLREAAGPGGPAHGGRVPYVLVVTRDLVPIERTVPLTALAGRTRPGIVDRLYPEGDLARFVPTVELPAGRAYLLLPRGLLARLGRDGSPAQR